MLSLIAAALFMNQYINMYMIIRIHFGISYIIYYRSNIYNSLETMNFFFSGNFVHRNLLSQNYRTKTFDRSRSTNENRYFATQSPGDSIYHETRQISVVSQQFEAFLVLSCQSTRPMHGRPFIYALAVSLSLSLSHSLCGGEKLLKSPV